MDEPQLEDLPQILNEILRKDQSQVFADEMLERLAFAYMDNFRLWHQCKLVLKQHRMVREVEPRVKMLVREMKDIPSIGGNARPERSVSEIWQKCPVGDDVYVPPGYSIDSSAPCIERIENRMMGDSPVQRHMPVCLDPIVITRRIGHMQSKELLLEVQFRTGVGWRKAIVDRSTMLNSRKIVDTAQFGLPVSSGNALEVTEWIRHYEQHNRDRIPMGFASNSMGWQGEEDNPTRHGFLSGMRQIGLVGDGRDIELEGSDGDISEARDIRERGEFQAWVAAAQRLSKFPAIRIGLCAAIASVLIAIVEGPNGVVEWAGRTSTGKSTVLRVAQSCWRPAANPMATWNSTIIGVEALARFFSDMPLIIDDTSAASEGGRSQNLGKVIYQLVSGRARGRATRDGSQKVRSKWRTMVLATGETPLGELAKAEGASARVLTFWSAPLGETSPETGALVTECLHELSENSGHAGPRVVQWLCENRDEWDNIRKLYQHATASVRRELCSPAAARLAEIVALLEVAGRVGWMAGCFPWMTGALLDDPDVVESIRNAVNLATTSSDRAYDAWEHLMGEAEAKVNSWTFWDEEPKGDRDPPGGWLGFKNVPKNEYGWYPQQLRKSLESAGFTPEAALRAWKDLGVIKYCEKSRFTSQCRPHGSRRKVRLIRVSTTYPGHEMNDDDDD